MARSSRRVSQPGAMRPSSTGKHPPPPSCPPWKRTARPPSLRSPCASGRRPNSGVRTWRAWGQPRHERIRTGSTSRARRTANLPVIGVVCGIFRHVLRKKGQHGQKRQRSNCPQRKGHPSSLDGPDRLVMGAGLSLYCIYAPRTAARLSTGRASEALASQKRTCSPPAHSMATSPEHII